VFVCHVYIHIRGIYVCVCACFDVYVCTSYIHMHIHIHVYLHACTHRYLYIYIHISYTSISFYTYAYGVAYVRRIDIIGLFCRIASLLWGSFAKETYNFIDPTNISHSIQCGVNA